MRSLRRSLALLFGQYKIVDSADGVELVEDRITGARICRMTPAAYLLISTGVRPLPASAKDWLRGGATKPGRRSPTA